MPNDKKKNKPYSALISYNLIIEKTTTIPLAEQLKTHTKVLQTGLKEHISLICSNIQIQFF